MRIATHSGPFHADDLVATALMKLVDPTLTVTRTRDPELLSQCDLRIDVGGRYDPQAGDFDHHFAQAPTRSSGIPYAATGLVWQHVAHHLVPPHLVAPLDEHLFAQLDSEDTGYAKTSMGPVSEALWAMNPTWLEAQEDPFFTLLDSITRSLHTLFEKLHTTPLDTALLEWKTNLCALAAPRRVAIALATEKAVEIITQALEGQSSSVLTLDVPNLPVIDTIHAAEHRAHRTVTHVVAPSSDGTWTLLCVPDAPGSFKSRVPLPESWAGLRGKDLSTRTGIPGAVFCHPGRWIAAWDSRSHAQEAATLAQRPDDYRPARGI